MKCVPANDAMRCHAQESQLCLTSRTRGSIRRGRGPHTTKNAHSVYHESWLGSSPARLCPVLQAQSAITLTLFWMGCNDYSIAHTSTHSRRQEGARDVIRAAGLLQVFPEGRMAYLDCSSGEHMHLHLQSRREREREAKGHSGCLRTFQSTQEAGAPSGHRSLSMQL